MGPPIATEACFNAISPPFRGLTWRWSAALRSARIRIITVSASPVAREAMAHLEILGTAAATVRIRST